MKTSSNLPRAFESRAVFSYEAAKTEVNGYGCRDVTPTAESYPEPMTGTIPLV